MRRKLKRRQHRLNCILRNGLTRTRIQSTIPLSLVFGMIEHNNIEHIALVLQIVDELSTALAAHVSTIDDDIMTEQHSTIDVAPAEVRSI